MCSFVTEKGVGISSAMLITKSSLADKQRLRSVAPSAYNGSHCADEGLNFPWRNMQQHTHTQRHIHKGKERNQIQETITSNTHTFHAIDYMFFRAGINCHVLE